MKSKLGPRQLKWVEALEAHPEKQISDILGIKEGDEIVSGPFLVVSKRLNDGDAIKSKEKEGGEKPDDVEEEASEEEEE